MKVRATNKYKELNVQDKELKRILKAGEEFEVSEERYKVLTENNKYNEVFVELLEDVKENSNKDKAVKEIEEKAIKKTRKKK